MKIQALRTDTAPDGIGLFLVRAGKEQNGYLGCSLGAAWGAASPMIRQLTDETIHISGWKLISKQSGHLIARRAAHLSRISLIVQAAEWRDAHPTKRNGRMFIKVEGGTR